MQDYYMHNPDGTKTAIMDLENYLIDQVLSDNDLIILINGSTHSDTVFKQNILERFRIEKLRRELNI